MDSNGYRLFVYNTNIHMCFGQETMAVEQDFLTDQWDQAKTTKWT